MPWALALARQSPIQLAETLEGLAGQARLCKAPAGRTRAQGSGAEQGPSSVPDLGTGSGQARGAPGPRPAEEAPSPVQRNGVRPAFPESSFKAGKEADLTQLPLQLGVWLGSSLAQGLPQTGLSRGSGGAGVGAERGWTCSPASASGTLASCGSGTAAFPFSRSLRRDGSASPHVGVARGAPRAEAAHRGRHWPGRATLGVPRHRAGPSLDQGAEERFNRQPHRLQLG